MMNEFPACMMPDGADACAAHCKALERIASLELRLIQIRDLLADQDDKDCLGVGYSDDCPPWPIVDEVIDSITQTLNR